MIKHREGERIDLSGYRQTVFQGLPAYERVSTQPGEFLERAPHFHYALMFRRAGAWFELHDSLSGDLKSLPPIIRQYFNTFRDRSAPAGIR